jgi:hypothetical protein
MTSMDTRRIILLSLIGFAIFALSFWWSLTVFRLLD